MPKGNLPSHSKALFGSATNTLGVNTDVPLPFFSSTLSVSPTCGLPLMFSINVFHELCFSKLVSTCHTLAALALMIISVCIVFIPL